MKERLLLVDDEPHLLSSLKRHLRHFFFVETSETAEEALKLIEHEDPFAVIISDYKMPGMDGVEFLTKSRHISPASVRILLTGYPDLKGAIMAINAGNVFRILTKPCPLAELMETLQAGIGLYHSLQEEKESRETMQHSLEKSQAAMQRMMVKVRRSLALTMEMKDPTIARHQKRTAHFARAICRELRLQRITTRRIIQAAQIHDIGMLSIPGQILCKTGPLTEHEYELIKTHPSMGKETLQTLFSDSPLPDIILQHHERLDGSGYPNGLTGKDIFFESKVLAVADVLEALTANRPYRPAHECRSALECVSQSSGVLFDAQVVEGCLSLYRRDCFS